MCKMIGSCGIVCSDCPAFIATQNDDEDLRKKTAADWAKMYDADIKPEDVFCVGCLQSNGRLFSHCNVCEIRKCCREKGIDNCAYCPDYACDKIIEFFGFVPDAKLTLERIRNS
ncbi:MAG TPA: DUF3795 domain-containing protein [Candidatus Cloacimonetes bacterium]|nr:DUF3795 domain-containing protein [Candidatus Cloacimonadota bacterium]